MTIDLSAIDKLRPEVRENSVQEGKVLIKLAVVVLYILRHFWAFALGHDFILSLSLIHIFAPGLHILAYI